MNFSFPSLACPLGGSRPALDPHFPQGDFSRSSHTTDLKLNTPVATLPGTWCYRVGAGTDRAWSQNAMTG